MKEYKYLNHINLPSDLRKLKVSELPMLCDELRDFIINETAHNPGHLGASLGTIELTVAIHYVFDTPNDKLVWDVGHQAYCHKIITGRKERFHTNRCYGGISGFPKMSESEYDSFGTGHSSTSISAILGMAVANRLAGNTEQNHIAVIGDGAMGGGMAFEAMNQAGATNANMLIILNDNKIAIDKNVGAMSRYLLRITSSPTYNYYKNRLWNFFTQNKKDGQSKFVNFLSKAGNVVKGFLLRGSNLFQSLGFRYFGPVDGHDVVYLVKVLRDLKKVQGPRLLHAITVKGKGLRLAESDQTTYHAPGLFNPDTGEILEADTEGQPPKFQDVFGDTILELAQQDEKIVGITPAMATGCSLTTMAAVFPERVFDVGIAEQHAVTFSAGMATQGYIPFCNIYSSFLQRAYDQIIHDVALQDLPVIFCIDRGGLVGEDGATHHGVFDLAFLRSVPNMIIASPRNEIELRNLMFTAYRHREHPFAIRYPRGRGMLTDWKKEMHTVEIGRAEMLQEGEKVLFLSLGPLANNVQKVIAQLETEGLHPAHVDMRFLKPLDENMLQELSKRYPVWITVEDGVKKGGLYSAVSEFLEDNHYANRLYAVAIGDTFVEHGKVSKLHEQCGFDAESIAALARQVAAN
ncbi:MAG: 1-deoxy-D-xylulose-5-phosphate synthase [Bacteroidales bacterium]|nr:1-deoxy-D-xylulose-5-phosphate synthase [Bacteroidales bacterium]